MSARQVTFLRRDGRRLVDGTGQPVLLRGVAVGNWWLPEGYMWRFGDAVPSPRQIEDFFVSLIGSEPAERFWTAYQRNYITGADVAQMAAEGLNSIRLPLNWRCFMERPGVWHEPAFALVDQLVADCRRHGLYVFLDLHGAPGGQTGTNIDDSPRRYPELFTDPAQQDATVALWVELARRYRDEPAIGGYDLLNEPLPRGFQYRYPDRLVALYQRLIEAIRRVDPDHLIVLEGSNWARNWSIFDRLWDDNVMLQFHKYWNAPDREHILEYLTKRDELEVPIWMGEGGENNLAWYQGSFQLYEDFDIGWNFWTWKRLAKHNAPVRVPEPFGWQDIVDHAYGGPRPSRRLAQRSLAELAENVSFANCEYRPAVLNAILRRLPVRLEAEYFGFKGAGRSYQVRSEAAHFPGFRVSDDVAVVYRRTGLPGPGVEEADFHHNHGLPRPPEEELAIILGAGEWTRYEVTAPRAGLTRCLLLAEGMDRAPAQAVLELDDQPVGRFDLGFDRAPVPADPVVFPIEPGRHDLTLRVVGGRVLADALVLDWADD
ncbi:MAG: glycoside hydrolase family 5 protein [Propionibacteriaceae bacterium]|jgi:aryl-phospho-beta-D-glucosidase BglC (GH1 family)|nr:glycoside hydrolase family 5 protein [Propionibacteriaceae bacterium]